MRKMWVYELLVFLLLTALLYGFACSLWLKDIEEDSREAVRRTQEIAEETRKQAHVMLEESEPEECEDYQLTPEEQECELLCDSLDLLALCVMAESRGESEFGKRLVIDTVLNRVDHPDFPDTIWDVITYPGAFTSYRNGQMDRVEPTQEIYRLICEERRNRTNTEVLYFNSGNYPSYGEPLLQEGNHYFSGEEVQK